ncbi:hypothetical protein DVS28_a2999 [Euzebya pacifica]|uniref:Uncharacterized protein n=1 Tax=Euzebya pacifica TaxID=1608957 RepID=A0A346XZN1_9ACTN|nr:hypothetical protein [Euzebya pacifica]AXV07678.1 hypothetical protein DVS28_a2999 [Euzebya pacifica]
MNIDQLRVLMEEAAANVTERHERPLPVTVVLPLEGATRVTALDGFPDDDTERKDALSVFAAQHMVPANAACFGLLAEATGPDGEDLMVVVYGARRRGSHVIAAMFDEDGALTEFTPSEPLEKTAMPFVQPLQHAADMAEAPDDPAAGGLPIITTS